MSGFGSKVQVSGFKVQGSRLRISSLGFRVGFQSSVFRASGEPRNRDRPCHQSQPLLYSIHSGFSLLEV